MAFESVEEAAEAEYPLMEPSDGIHNGTLALYNRQMKVLQEALKAGWHKGQSDPDFIAQVVEKTFEKVLNSQPLMLPAHKNRILALKEEIVNQIINSK